MDQALKRKWVRALRSGKYKQARDMLRNPKTGGMCCLGVLCHIQGARSAMLDNYQETTLPRGFNAAIRPAERRFLASKNDGGSSSGGIPHTFKQIADWIEKHL